MNPEEKLKAWGNEIKGLDHVAQIFVDYITGKLKKHPFAEGALSPETQ